MYCVREQNRHTFKCIKKIEKAQSMSVVNKLGVEKFPSLNTEVQEILTRRLVFSKDFNDRMGLAKLIAGERVFQTKGTDRTMPGTCKEEKVIGMAGIG